MTVESQQRLKGLIDKILKHFNAGKEIISYEEAIAAIRAECRDKSTSPAAWLHKRAGEIYPTSQPNTVQPEYFYEILGQIDTKEKFDSVLAALPEDSVPDIERFLKFLSKDFLPSQRLAAQQLVKRLPQRRNGGAPSKTPSSADESGHSGS